MSQTQRTREPLSPAPQYHAHAKQRAVVESDARYRVLKWGRRAGKNIAAAIDTVEYVRQPWRSAWGADDPEDVVVWWVAPSYDQANEHGFQKIKATVPPSWIESERRSKPRRLRFTNGAEVQFRTYDHPETLQGSGIDRHVVDEADQMPRQIWDGDLEPMLLDTRGSALFISKVYRPRSYFHEFFDYGQSAEYPEYASWHATSADNPFLAESPSDKRGTVPEHVYRMEYLAEVPDDGGQVFRSLSDRLFTAGDDWTAHTAVRRVGDQLVGTVRCDLPDPQVPYSIGADFARKRDFRVTTVLDATGDLAYWHRDRNESWDGIEDHLLDIADTYPGVLVPDAQRDAQINSRLEGHGVPIHPMTLPPKTKKALIEDLATRIENGDITAPQIPAMDRLALELRQLRRDVTASGYTSYHAPENEFDDCVDSLALAAAGLDLDPVNADERMNSLPWR